MKPLLLALTFIGVPVVCLVLGRPLIPHLALAWGGFMFGLFVFLLHMPWARFSSATKEERTALMKAWRPSFWVFWGMRLLWVATTLAALWGLP